MKTVIEMALEVYGAHTEWVGAPLDRLEQLVALVRADEREACAKVCEAQMTGFNPVGDMAREDCADAIRARS